MAKLIDVDAFIKKYCEDCGYGCDLADAHCATVEDLMNFPAAVSVSEIDFDYEAEDD